MKTPEEFEQYFAANMRPTLAELEAERLRYMPHLLRWLGWVLLVWVVGFGWALAAGWRGDELYEDLLPLHVPVVFALFIITGWRLIRYVVHAEPLLQRCKGELIVPMLRWLAPELEYDPEGCVDTELAAESGLVRAHDSLTGEDRFRGRLGATELEFGELVVHWHRVERDRDGRSRTVHHQEHGLFLVASGNKPFTGETRIYEDLLEGLIGDTAARALTISHKGGGLHLIHMEDPAFERLFRVYCTDDVEAHYILTPSLMARLTAYREKAGRDVRLCFREARLTAYFPPEPGKAFALFDVSGFGDMRDIANYRLIYDELAMALGIVEELNLNTRIWG